MKYLSLDFYPPHLVVGNFLYYVRKGVKQIGRHIECLACNVTNNSRTRNGDAKFLKQHRRCVIYKGLSA
jgi:hypothetical protein